MNCLKYNSPARNWEEALPIGNGNQGSMIFSVPEKEHIQINEISLWSGGPYPDADKTEAYKHLPEIRSLIDKRNYRKAQQIMDKEMTNNGGGFEGAYSGSYQTFGDIFIEFDNVSSAENYVRYLDIDNAIAGCSFVIDRAKQSRVYFASASAGVQIYHFNSEKENSLNCSVYACRDFCKSNYASDDEISFFGQADGDEKGVSFAMVLKAVSDGAIKAEGERLLISNAKDIYLYVCCATDYVPDESVGFHGYNPLAFAEEKVRAASLVDYDELKRNHIADFRSFFDRMSITLPVDDLKNIDTVERLRRFNNGDSDNGLISLLFQYGRYLLISSSRPDNQLPANLQGLWCKDYKAPWHCDYHANINVQMNYWPAGPANIAFCTDPFARLISSLVSNGRKTAKAYYNAPGWTCYTITNPFFWTSPGWGGGWSQYPLGGAWLCRHLYEYYAYTGDENLLKKYFPVIEENCLFNLELPVKDTDGTFITSPATSPENNFRDGRKTGWLSKGTAMDIEMLYDNFTITAHICDILGGHDELKKKVLEMRANLKPLKIGCEGQLCEWYGDWDMKAPEINHRHVSHLYGLHPGNMISPQKTPELAKAAAKSLEIRGEDGTGWSLAWKINFAARLRDGEMALRLIKRLLRPVSGEGFNYSNGGGVYLNLFDAHPPFQIDGNFGVTAGVCEMLLQSHQLYKDRYFIIDFIPALPEEWSEGSVSGIVARGNFVCDFDWSDMKLNKAVIHASIGGKCVVYGKYRVFCDDKAVDTEYDEGLTVFETECDGIYKVLPLEE